MGLRRITGVVEVIYSADDGRGLEQLAESTREGIQSGVKFEDGLLASFVVTSKSVDPDPEPSADDVVPDPDQGTESG